MKARIKFQKYGAMKFIGHLDVMRYFQKAFRRAHFDNEYTKGFNPHQIMSFAAPLGVGLTSDAEYLDINLLSGDSPKVMVERLNEVLTEGFCVTGFQYLTEQGVNEKKIKAMALVESSDYIVALKDGYTLGDTCTNSNPIVISEEFQKAFLSFYGQPAIVISKKTKTSEKEVDIKPMISLVAFSEEEYRRELKDKLSPIVSNITTGSEAQSEISYRSYVKSMADIDQNGIKVYLQLDTGSKANLKPELVMEAFCQNRGIPYSEFAWQVHRLEVYTRDGEVGKLIPLDQVEY